MNDYSVKSIKGEREYMEDRYAYVSDSGITIALICDGHGDAKVANATCYYFPKILLDTLKENYLSNSHVAIAIRKTIIDWGIKHALEPSGCTLTGIAIKNGVMYLFNVGDSRTCVRVPGTCIYHLAAHFNNKGEYVDNIHINYRNVKGLFCTIDHEPGSPAERTRIMNSGGAVVDIEGLRLNGILSLSRAIGDAGVGPGLSFVPDIFWFRINKSTGPVVMYTDGIYEMARYGSARSFAPDLLYTIGARDGADALVDYALENGSSDNLTALVVNMF